MKKHLLISGIIIGVGFGVMYWSGLISGTTDNNWQGIAGITITCVGVAVLVAPFVWVNVIKPTLLKSK